MPARLLLARRNATLGVFLAALGVYAIESLAWPLAPGRDAGTYLLYYLDMWNSRPVYPELMLFRTPLAPLVYGPLLTIGGAVLAEAMMAVLFGISVVGFVLAADILAGARAALATALLLLAYPPYGALFHQVSSDPIFALTFSLFTLQIVRLWKEASYSRAAGAAVLLLAAVLARPSAEVLLVLAPLLLLLPLPFRRRIAIAATFLVASVGLLAGYSAYNDLRYGDFTVSRLEPALVPFYRTFVVDRIVQPDNGPASRRLAAAVQRDLLPEEPYSAYGIGIDKFFSSGSTRMFADLVGLSDRVWGWKSAYGTLRAAAFEGIERHPRAFAAGVLGTLRTESSDPYQWWPPAPPVQVSTPAASPTILVNGRRVPKPTEGEPIPASHLWWLASTPTGSLWMDWSSLQHPILRSLKSGGAQRLAGLDRRLRRLTADLPNRSGSHAVASWLNALSRDYPRPPFWVLFGLVGCFVARRRQAVGALALVLVAAAVVGGTALGEPAVIEYRLPLDPIFILFAIVSAALAAAPVRGVAASARRRLVSG